MKEKYIQIMEEALSCYTKKEIVEYLTSVELDGYKEHGFPRLTANIGILMSFGKRLDLKDIFVRMMNACTLQMPNVDTTSCIGYGNDFSVFEICNCLKAIKSANLFDDRQVNVWFDRMRSFKPSKGYNCVAHDTEKPIENWAVFGALSEIARGKILGTDETDFIELQIANQLLALNDSGLYKDPGNPIIYDLGPRVLFALMLKYGYNGKHKKTLSDILEKSADITAKMQSTTGEVPFGGRSNQMVFNEMVIAALMEYYADFYNQKGDTLKAGKMKAAAVLAKNRTLSYFEREVSSHVKNCYPHDLQFGCESYAYFNKYMITTASYAHWAYLLSDDSIAPLRSVAEQGEYALKTDDDFHKLYLNAGGYFAEFELNADFLYDANGLGRVHKKGCLPTICLSVPFPSSESVGYKTECSNARPMSICCYCEKDGKTFYGSQKSTVYNVLSVYADSNISKAEIQCELSKEIKPVLSFSVTSDGVQMSLKNTDNCDTFGFMLPVFDFDGNCITKIIEKDNELIVRHCDSSCSYSFSGNILGKEKYHNRNGRYKVYKVQTENVVIRIV